MRSPNRSPLRLRGGLIAGGTAVLAGVVLIVSLGVGGAAAAAKTTKCTGTPAVIETDTNLSSPVSTESPEIPAGAEAAAAEITKTCELGVPLHIVSCDDQFSPNGATTCGNEAVSDNALTIMGYSGYGDNYATPAFAAGIPIMPIAQSSSLETSSPMSYAFGEGLPLLYSQLQLAAAAGGKKIAIVAYDIPEVAFVVNLLTTQAAKAGIQVAGVISVPPTATDMTSYAEQVISDGADSVTTVIAASQEDTLYKDLVQLGHPLKQIHAVSSLSQLEPRFIQNIGISVANGLLSASWSVSPTQTSLAPVKQYLSELAADHQPHGKYNVDSLGLTAWAEVHILADALKAKHLAPKASNVAAALTTNAMPTLTTHYGLVPINFTHVAFPNDPVLSKLRVFTSYSYDYQFNNKGVPIQLVKHPVNVLAGAPKLKHVK